MHRCRRSPVHCAQTVAKEHQAIALIRNTELGPKGRQDVFVQPGSRLRYKIGSFWDREKGTGSSVAGAIDGYERDTVGVARGGCGVFGIGIEVMAFISTTMETYDQRAPLNGRLGAWRYVVNARDCSSIWQGERKGFHCTRSAQENEGGDVTVRDSAKEL